MLTRWHQLQKEKREYQKQQQQQHSQWQPINFDEIMETDLNRQLQELEQEEEEQYNLLKQALDLELNYNDNQPSIFNIQETKEQLQQIETLKQYEKVETSKINQQVNIS